MTLKRMDNVLIVVDDLETAKAFFIDPVRTSRRRQSKALVALIGLKDVRATLAMMRTPDGQWALELDKFHTPNAIRVWPRGRAANTLNVASCSPSMTSTLSLRACAHTGLSSLAKCSTRTRTA